MNHRSEAFQLSGSEGRARDSAKAFPRFRFREEKGIVDCSVKSVQFSPVEKRGKIFDKNGLDQFRFGDGQCGLEASVVAVDGAKLLLQLQFHL